MAAAILKHPAPIPRILSVVALGTSISPYLKIAEELVRLYAELVDCPRPLKCVTAWSPPPQGLQRHLLRARPGMVHLCGHGNLDGSLLGVSRTGETALLPRAALVRVMADSLSVRVVTLGACFRSAETSARTACDTPATHLRSGPSATD